MQAVAQFAPQVTDEKLHRCQHITGVACSADGRHVLANYLNDHIYLFSLDGTGEGSCPEQAPEYSTGSRRARADVTADSASMRTAVLRSALPGLTRSTYAALHGAADPDGSLLPAACKPHRPMRPIRGISSCHVGALVCCGPWKCSTKMPAPCVGG